MRDSPYAFAFLPVIQRAYAIHVSEEN